MSKIALKTADYKFVRFIKFDSSEKTKRYLLNLDSEISGLSLKSIITHDVLKSEYTAYLNEINGKYDEPLAAVIKFLSENASDNDIIAINFDQLSLAYYLDLKIANMIDKEKLAIAKKFTLPDYILGYSDADWYIDHPASLLQGPVVNKSGVLKPGGEIFDTGINTLYWDGNWPQRFRNYANKYLFKEEAFNETVKIYKLNSSK
ncbi:MAG: hypothetical protein HYU98_02445 [Deltaproteobacteria bacterium]|nr:hypothetical protein [Deltaproteobacteria bacterium]